MKNIFQNHDLIAVDCDEVLAATFEYFLLQYNLKNTDGVPIQLSDIKNYNFSQNEKFGKSSDEYVEMFVELFKNDILDLCLPSFPHAKETLEQLKSDGKKLYVVTARQSFLETYTKNWIEKYFPQIFEDIYFCNHEGGGAYLHKSEVCKKLGASLLIEDNYSYAQECAEAGIEVVLLEKPWNSNFEISHSNIKRISDWSELKS